MKGPCVYFYFDLKLYLSSMRIYNLCCIKRKGLKVHPIKPFPLQTPNSNTATAINQFWKHDVTHVRIYKNTWYMTWLFWKTARSLYSCCYCVAPSSSSTSFSTLSDISHLNAPSLSDKGYNRFLHLNWEKLTFRLQRKLQLNATEPLCLRIKK